ncbi:hypothetical protein VBD025_02755 [Virgibacillus flavescens]|uniref:hypothetical protein n=1 Tax=Virgibacillus flavescens TaxID=1611422 RepID=UPI003D344435
MSEIVETILNPKEMTLEEKLEGARKRIEGIIYQLFANEKVDIEGAKKVLEPFDDEWLIKKQENVNRGQIIFSRNLARNLTNDRISVEFIEDVCHVDRSIFKDYIDIGGREEYDE